MYYKLRKKRCLGCLTVDAERAAAVREAEDKLDEEETAHQHTRYKMTKARKKLKKQVKYYETKAKSNA